MRAVHLRRAAMLWASMALLLGTGAVDAGRPGTSRQEAPLCLYVGYPTVISFPAVRQAEVVTGQEFLEAVALSDVSVRVSAARPGVGCLRIDTPTGREFYTLRAEAGPGVEPPGPAGSLQDARVLISRLWRRLVSARGDTAPADAPGNRAGVAVTHHARASRPAFAAGASAARVRPTLSASRLSAPPSMHLATPPASAQAVASSHSSSYGGPLRAMASRWRLAVPGGGGPRVDPGAMALVPRVSPPREGVGGARTAAQPIARFPGSAAPRRETTEGAALPSLDVSVLAGARPVSTTARVIPGLPQPAAEPPDEPVRISMVEGKSRILPAQGVRTVQIDDPTGAVAEVQPVSETEILLLARGPGTTMVRIWDRRGRTEYELTIEPGPARRQQSIQDAIGDKTITVRVVENTCILEGEVVSIEQMLRAQKIAEAFVGKVVNLLRLPTPPSAAPAGPPEPGLVEQVQAVLPAGEVTAEALPGQPTTIVLRGKAPRVEDIGALVAVAEKVVEGVKGTVVNLIQLAQPRQVRVQARMLNVDDRLLRELGVRWMDPSTGGPMLFGQAVPSGSFRLLTSIQANINTLVEDARAELLSAPSTVVNSGAAGYIHIGGEVPIPQTSAVGGAQGGGAALNTAVTYRNFGVVLSIEPVVEPGEEITLRLLVEVSSIDRNNSVTINGSAIPGFSTKRALNELRLKAGETLVIGGLISREEASTVHKFPILADIPVFGSFFRSVRKEKLARELVLFLTPELLPGPEPPAGLRQTPVLKPDTSGPAGPFSLGTGVATQGSGGGGGASAGGTGGGGR